MLIERVGVVGCGLMGSGIAEVTARAGLDVVVTESSPSAAEAGMARVAASLKRALTSGRLSEEEHDATWKRLAFGHDLAAVADCDIVVEAVAEHEPTKLDVFGRLDSLCKPQAVLASNTSSIPIMKLARATKREAQVIGIHFFNPVPVLPLVELVTSLLTSPQTATRSATSKAQHGDRRRHKNRRWTCSVHLLFSPHEFPGRIGFPHSMPRAQAACHEISSADAANAE